MFSICQTNARILGREKLSRAASTTSGFKFFNGRFSESLLVSSDSENLPLKNFNPLVVEAALMEPNNGPLGNKFFLKKFYVAH